VILKGAAVYEHSFSF